MRKDLIWTFVLVLMLLFAGCVDKSSAAEKRSSEVAHGNKGTSTEEGSSSDTAKDELILPESYPKEVLPLVDDAKILDVRENPTNKGLEVSYVSENDIDVLCNYFEVALQDAKNLSTTEMPDGYMITAKLESVSYFIMLSTDALKFNHEYFGRTSVYIMMTGLEDVAVGSKLLEDEGEAWPLADLPGVPQFKGHINKILREDGVIWLEIKVEGVEKVISYVRELTESSFSFDAEPDTKSDHVQFVAFKDNSVLNFDYDAKESYVTIEYHK